MRKPGVWTSTLLFVQLAILGAGAHARGGTIEGRVVFEGSPKQNPLIQMGADPNCLEINAGRKVHQKYIDLHSGRSIANVFVHLTDDLPAAGPAPTEPVVIDQRGCMFAPRVVGAMVGQVLKVRNSDHAIHSVKSSSAGGNQFNFAQYKAGTEDQYRFEAEDVMLRLKCLVHDWMVSFIGVKSHPYFAVSRADGSFRIEGVPPGTYTVQAWQERLGAVEQRVDVTEGETARVQFTYQGSSSDPLVSGLQVQELLVPTD